MRARRFGALRVLERVTVLESADSVRSRDMARHGQDKADVAAVVADTSQGPIEYTDTGAARQCCFCTDRLAAAIKVPS